MKHLLKITSAVLVLLLCALGGVFLWRSGFFAALSSQQALQDYISQFAPYSHLCFFLLQFLSVVLAPIPATSAPPPAGCSSAPGPPFFLPSPRSSPPPCWSFSWHARWANLLRTAW